MTQLRPRTAADYGAAFAAALYYFTASVPTAGALHSLRDPDPPELYEDDDGSGQD
ncbi:hypothetical protein [Streptomyces sp. NPDC088727]|uniref:hypothetical protein n=1 Tax=Streptomyces sp. NPDC088727 TaxID=3365875 RepID=UPI003809468D